MTHFTSAELQCPCCKQLKLAWGFLDDLNELRERFGEPMRINSAYRCEKHNAEVGGKRDSFHLKGCAVDVNTTGWHGSRKWRLVSIAMASGWSVGVARTFLHLDKRADYPEFGWPQPSLFPY